VADAANARARAVMLDEQLRDLRAQMEKGSYAPDAFAFETLSGSDLGEDPVLLDLGDLRAASSFE